MSETLTSGTSWTCGCGRKVPGRVDACRCGQQRPVETTASGAADWAERRAAEQRSAAEASGSADGGLFGSKSLIQFGGAVLVFALLFGSRYYNRYRVSSEMRETVIAELAKARGEKAATEAVDKVHWGCFEPNYHMAFKRRGGGSTFDEERCAACMVRALR